MIPGVILLDLEHAYIIMFVDFSHLVVLPRSLLLYSVYIVIDKGIK